MSFPGQYLKAVPAVGCDLLCFKSEILQACWDLTCTSVNLWQF